MPCIDPRCVTALLFTLTLVGSSPAGEPVNFVVGTGFRSALEQPFSPTWDHIDLRMIARTVQEGPGVSLLLDRRIDPTAERSLKVTNATLRESFDRLAAECDAGATIIGSTVYLGPHDTAGKLRTLVALRKAELKELQIPESRRNVLSRSTFFQWADLDQPADLVRRLAEEHRLDSDGIDLIPHDLWAGGVLPEATPIEALSLVLAQFDLTFSWIDQARGVRIEPIPERVAIDRPHDPPRGMSPAEAISRWQEEIPGLEARAAGSKVIVSGTEELHEVVDRARRGGRVAEKAASNAAAQVPPLKLKRYKATIENIPVSDLMRYLENPAQGMVTFEYDRAEFKAAGIDLDRRVSFELKKDSRIEDFLKAAFDPVGVTFEIQDRTVRLKPAKRN
jgi:hypothetical protein